MDFVQALLKVIHHQTLSDNYKRECILTVVQHYTTRQVTFEDASAVFNTLFSKALEYSSPNVAVLSLFAFTTCGSKYSCYLREYLTRDQITRALAEDDPLKLVIVLRWLKEIFQILKAEGDYVSNISPVLSGILQSKLEDCGKNSSAFSRLAELYLFIPSLLPTQNIRAFTVSIMKCVAAFPTPTKPDTLKHMKYIGDLITHLWQQMMLEDLLKTLYAMYSIISNTDTTVEVCPAMAHLLSLVNIEVVEKLGPRIVSDFQNPNAAFVATLSRLSTWLVAWPTAHKTLVHWIRILVHLLYQYPRRCFVPAKVTSEQVPKLLERLTIPVCRQGVMSAANIFLMSFQYSPVVFHKVIPQLISMIQYLEKEATESSKKTLDELIKLCHGQMVLYPGHPDTYQPLMDVVSKHKAPPDDEIQSFISDYQWANCLQGTGPKSLFRLLSNSSSKKIYQQRLPGQRVGLRNLGNTCYMNSVIQALFMTDDFRHSVLHMSPKANQHLLVKLQRIFSLLCFSQRTHITPKNFHNKSRPSWFNPGMQQDCSEYLRHLMSTLHEEERAGQKLPEYQERVIIESETASLASDLQPLPDDTGQDAQMELDDEFQVDMNDDFKGSSQFSSNDFKEYYYNDSGTVTSSDNQEGIMSVDSINNPSKRKYNISPVTSQIQGVKISKGEMLSSLLSEVDNSSDSGISGDLAEDMEFPQLSSPVSSQKDVSLPNSNSLAEDMSNCSDYFVSQVHKYFGGKISTCIKCLNCKTESIHKDVFTDINLTFQDSEMCNAVTIIKKQPDKEETGCPPVDLKIEKMIDSYLTPERLSGENQYECDRCGTKQDAERSIQILESPEHLILTQLRFYYDTSKQQRQKVFTNVEFEEELLLPIKYSTPTSIDGEGSSNPHGIVAMETHPSFSSNPVHYDNYSLYAVVVHSGFSSEGGHYYCYARSSSVAGLPSEMRDKFGDLGEWYNFNDEKVTKTTFSSFSKLTRTFTRDTAYILFYRKVILPSPPPIIEDFSTLSLELKDLVSRDNVQYQFEQENEFLKSSHFSGPLNGADDDQQPPKGGCGGGGGLDMSSRVVF